MLEVLGIDGVVHHLELIQLIIPHFHADLEQRWCSKWSICRCSNAWHPVSACTGSGAATAGACTGHAHLQQPLCT